MIGIIIRGMYTRIRRQHVLRNIRTTPTWWCTCTYPLWKFCFVLCWCYTYICVINKERCILRWHAVPMGCNVSVAVFYTCITHNTHMQGGIPRMLLLYTSDFRKVLFVPGYAYVVVVYTPVAYDYMYSVFCLFSYELRINLRCGKVCTPRVLNDTPFQGEPV